MKFPEFIEIQEFDRKLVCNWTQIVLDYERFGIIVPLRN